VFQSQGTQFNTNIIIIIIIIIIIKDSDNYLTKNAFFFNLKRKAEMLKISKKKG